MPRIIVDCTHTFQTGAGTGIQRVVRHLADSLLEIGPAEGVEVLPARVSGGQLVALPLMDGHVAFPRAEGAREAAPDDPAWRRLQALRLTGHRVNRLVRSRRLAAWLDAGPNENGLARRIARKRQAAEAPDAIARSSGDIVLSLDSSWVYDIRTVLEDAGRAGVVRIAVLCDVLPLSHPRWFTEGTRRYFRGWIEVLLPRLDGLVTISEATLAELHALVKSGEIGASVLPPSTAVHLGAEIAAAEGGPVRPQLESLLAPGRPPALLTVGTLEPRKNVDYALDLFDRLIERGLEVQWHVVGAPGWLAEHTASRIRNHPAFGDSLHWWTNLGDAELAWLYRRATALVATSNAEGFGLPLVEARMHGLPVFASDIPVFREVMAGEARYLPLGCPRLAALVLEDFLRGAVPPAGCGEPSKVARPWRDSAAELLDFALRLHRVRHGGGAAFPGTPRGVEAK
jgi:glycosyltransferase involved in cell wall biosynthesis